MTGTAQHSAGGSAGPAAVAEVVDRAQVQPAGRELLDTLAAVGGHGWLTRQPGAVFTLEVIADPRHPESRGVSGVAGRLNIANYKGATLQGLRAAHLVDYRDDGGVFLTPAGAALAQPSRRRAELAGIAAVVPPEGAR